MNRSVKLDSMSTRSKMMSSNAKKLSKRNAFPRLKVLFWLFYVLFCPNLAFFDNNDVNLMMSSIVKTMAIQVVEFSNGGYKIRKIFP